MVVASITVISGARRLSRRSRPLFRFYLRDPLGAFNRQDFTSILTMSTHYAEQVQDHRDQHHRSDDSQAPACSPSGIPIIAAASAEQQKQNYN
jgi:hypothetical protein